MSKQENHSETIANLIEQMIDLRFAMLTEKQYNNYREYFLRSNPHQKDIKEV